MRRAAKVTAVVGAVLSCMSMAACTDQPLGVAEPEARVEVLTVSQDVDDSLPQFAAAFDVTPEICAQSAGAQTNGACDPPCTTCDPYNPPEPYDAPNDPSPGAPGVWLGDAVSPATCFRTYNSAVSDRDSDALDDGCEYKLAKAFAPELRFHNRDECLGGDKYWAAKYFAGPGVIRVAYLPAYYRDCGVPNEFKAFWLYLAGKNSHTGDSEFIMVEAKFNASTRHWEFVRMFLSAHDGGPNERSSWVPAEYTIFPLRSKTYPAVYVARNKHANYRSESVCESDPFGGQITADICANDYKSRFWVWEFNGNVGSRSVDYYPSGVYKRGTFSGRKEYFYKQVRFNGWVNDGSAGGASPYYDFLVSDKFEYYANYYGGSICQGTCPVDPQSLDPPELVGNYTVAM
jgi:hypothetical protein